MAKNSRESAMKIVNKVLPIHSKRRETVKAIIRKRRRLVHNELSYEDWIKHKEPLTILDKKASTNPKSPLISVVVPCYNTPEKYIKALVDSLITQTYPKWQLCLADGSSNEEDSEIIKQIGSYDRRIIYVKINENLGIAANTNKGLEVAEGDYIAFLDHDDILPNWALNEIALSILDNPKADIFYSDEDRLSEDGKIRMSPLFKPDWSPDLFLCANYVAHFSVAKKSLVDKLHGLRSDYDGSQDYDFILRSLDYDPQIIHIPKILYHMRMAETSTAKRIGIKSYAHVAGNKALADYFKRNHIKAEVQEIPKRPTNHKIRYEIKGNPKASIIIPFKDKPELLDKCVNSILKKTTYKNYEIILISNNSVKPKTQRFLDSLKSKKIKKLTYDKPFNYSALNNFGRKNATGEVLVFLNNDTEIINSEWLEELMSVALQKDRGAVGALLLYPDKTIQHAGVVLGMVGAAGHIFKKQKLGHLTPFWLPDWPRDYLAVTGACMAVEAKKFDKVKGFDEGIIMAGSDVVLCLELYKLGFLNVYWPYAKLKHYESKSVGSSGSYQTAPSTDYERAIGYYRPYLDYKDPYFNPNLDLGSEHDRTSEQVKLRSNYE